jgi:putative addiction module component (TIGR02574 family)
MSPILAEQISRLSLQEKILLVEELWDEIAADAGTVTLTEAQKNELDVRLLSLAENPESGKSWDEIKADIQKRLT